MSIDAQIRYSRMIFKDLRNCMTDEELVALAKKIWDNKNYEECEPNYITTCLANQIIERLM
jgi:hypothetical protein